MFLIGLHNTTFRRHNESIGLCICKPGHHLQYARAVFCVVMVSLCSALAVPPLTVDDADTVEPGRLQLNAGWQVSRTSSTLWHRTPVNPVLGLSSYAELGLLFGYQWNETTDQPDEEGIMDTVFACKWRIWQTRTGTFKSSARFDLNLPTASASRGLGTGTVDSSAILIGTWFSGSTCLDLNLGYTVSDLSHGEFGDDHWFIGQAVRHQLSQRWCIIAEIYALVPNDSDTGTAQLFYNGGAQLNVNHNFTVSVLIGSAAGPDTPNLTSYVGFTWVF